MARRNPSWSKQNRPSFFKILFGDLFFTTLRVPPAFLTNYLKRINFPTESTIALKSDLEVSWKVKMEKMEGGEVYFTDGWKKVAKEMNLETRDFLVFYLVGDNAVAFELRAYDLTCCEKMTEWCLSSSSETESGDGDGGDDDVDEEEEEDVDEEEHEDEEDEENADGEEEIECIVTETDEPTWKKTKQNQSGGESRALQADSELFTSKYPFFQVNITANSLSKGGSNVPWSFVKSNLNMECKHQILTLGTGGRCCSWPVKLIIFSSPNHRARLCGGFITFLEENNVNAGDLCTFELVNKKNLVFRVSIYRG